MRKRELQSIPLKLAELQEYDMVKMVRALGGSNSKTPREDAAPSIPVPIATNVGPKTQKEIQERINLELA